MSDIEGIQEPEQQLSNHGNSHGYIPHDDVQGFDCPQQADRRYETIVAKREDWDSNIEYYVLRDTESGDYLIASIGPDTNSYHVKTVFNPCTVATTSEWKNGSIPADPVDVSGDARYNARLNDLLYDATEIESIGSSSLTCYDANVADTYTIHIHTEAE